jgi:hypothetical protein
MTGTEFVESYLKWLRERMSTQEIDGVCEITTPFLDRHNDRLQIYVRRSDKGRLLLTDDGYILSDLESTGCPINTDHRKHMLHVILKGFGVQEKEGELYIETDEGQFPRAKHSLLQAMLNVNDLFMTARPHVAQLFTEDVAHFLDQHEVRYTPNAEFTGKSGFLHRFDFVIPKSRKRPERMIKTLNHPTKENVRLLIFSWSDTKDTRPPSEMYAFLNDVEADIHSDILSAFESYDISPVPWTRREEFTQALAI